MGAPVYSTDACVECHGADLSGGISNVSCTACHLGGPTSVHPGTWDPIYLNHGPSVSSGATPTSACSNALCHGTSLQGVADSGPSCTSCHSMPFDAATVICGACHSIPPDGTKFPDLAGKHAKHAATNTTSCDVCHSGASAYVGDHHNDVINFSFPAAYLPKSGGTPTFDSAAKTCTNISCHGGPRTQTQTQAASGQSTLVTTPNWYTGTIDVATQCTACHVYGAIENNSYSSGDHYLHVWEPGNGPEPKLGCTICHDPAKLASAHFTSLGTPQLEGPASATLRSSLNYSGGSCNPDAGNMSGCHGGENW
jgi:predicted CxxxxCH...CXXCH cytochrome family protein